MELFCTEESIQEPRGLQEMVRLKDRRGILVYLQALPPKQMIEECLKAGFSMIGRHHGKEAMIEHVMRQVFEREQR